MVKPGVFYLDAIDEVSNLNFISPKVIYQTAVEYDILFSRKRSI